MNAGTSITPSGRSHAIGYRMGWLFWIAEAALVFAAMAFSLIAAFLAPAHHETFATLASARRTDFAIAVAVVAISLVAVLALEFLHRKLRNDKQSLASPPQGLLHRLSQRKRDEHS